MIQPAPHARRHVLLIAVITLLLVTGGWLTPPRGVVAADAGTSRAMPVPRGTELVNGNLGLTVTEVIRGKKAWERLKDANSFNPERPKGQEYVLIRVKMRHTGKNDDQAKVTSQQFGLTASGNAIYLPSAVVPPEPALDDIALYPGDQLQGWLALFVGTDEQRLQLVYLPDMQEHFDRWRFLALEEGDGGLPVASDGDPNAPTPNDLGAKRDTPVQPGDTAVTDTFAVTVLDVQRGEEATKRVQEVSSFNPAPGDGNEYVLTKIRMTYRGGTPDPVLIFGADFAVIGKAQDPYGMSFIFLPQPDLYGLLYPGGTMEGWIAFEIKADEENPTLVFLRLGDPDPQPRFFALSS